MLLLFCFENGRDRNLFFQTFHKTAYFSILALLRNPEFTGCACIPRLKARLPCDADSYTTVLTAVYGFWKIDVDT